MEQEKFQLNQYSINSIIGMIQADEFVIPEIQRPFVWKKTQVRDLIDSLFNGYPTGYIITWKNPDIKTKDGKISNGRHMLIDGQQRITALMTALAGIEVLDKNFNVDRIKIAFNPLENDISKRFEVQDASHLRDKRWIPDISILFSDNFDNFSFCMDYSQKNPEVTPQEINNRINQVKDITQRNIGIIELSNTLDIDEVTEIFIRINSKGTPLNQSDFVMSKMASDDKYGGNKLRKLIDYFCHLSSKPEFLETIKKDSDFYHSSYYNDIKWVAKENDEIYAPNYADVLRVAFMYSFNRGKIADLVSLLSGRDFETRDFKEEIIEKSYFEFEDGIKHFINQYNYQQFILAIKGAGFISTKLTTSSNTMNFAYYLYLKLHNDKSIPNVEIKHYVQKWYVLCTLTGRYSSSPESNITRDIIDINEKGFIKFFEDTEKSILSDNFWKYTIPQSLNTSATYNNVYKVFLASQIYQNTSSLFMKGLSISDLITINGDIHHIFPRNYLIKNGIKDRRKYNQVANYTYVDSQVNKAISDTAPNVYFTEIKNQVGNKIGNLQNENEFTHNLKENAIPEDIINMTSEDYDDFLQKRRILMAQAIKKYYESL